MVGSAGIEADAVCGERSAERVNSRNGYRHRDLDTRMGTLDVVVPKLRQGSLYPDWLLERRKRAEQALTSVVATCHLLGVSTRRCRPPLHRHGNKASSNPYARGYRRQVDTHGSASDPVSPAQGRARSATMIPLVVQSSAFCASICSRGYQILGPGGRLLGGFSLFFACFPGVGIVLGGFFVILAAWHTKSYTLATFLLVLVIPFLICAVTGLLFGGTFGFAGVILAYPAIFMFAGALFWGALGSDYMRVLESFNVTDTLVTNPFMIFIPLFLALLSCFTTWVGVPAGAACREMIAEKLREP